MTDDRKYYLQDTRQGLRDRVMVWLAVGDFGVATDLARARAFTWEEARYYHSRGKHLKPWPKKYIDDHVMRICNVHHVNYDDTGIVIKTRNIHRKIEVCSKL